MKASDGLRFCEKYSPVPLVPLQKEILAAMFGNRFCLVVEPSGWGKTLKAALHIGGHLICSKKKVRSFGIAGDQAQAGLLHAALVEIFAHPDLRRLVAETTWVLKLRHAPKSEHQTLATSPSTLWGITPRIVTSDELSEATPQAEKNFFAAVSSLRKQRDSKLVIITSPGIVGTTAHRIVESVRGDPKWCLIELTSEDYQPPWLDLESDSVYDALLPPEIREAKHKGIWAVEGGGVLSREKIEAMELDCKVSNQTLKPHSTL